VSPTHKTPANAAIAVGVLAAIPILVTGPFGGFVLSIAATGTIYLSYLLCNIGVLQARWRGWPRKPAWFNLGRWGMTVNVLAVVYGAVMLLNIALWNSPMFGDFGGEGRAYWNPMINSFLQWFGKPLDWLPAWPLFETIIVTLLVTGAVYYIVSVRGRAADVEADAATGEKSIG
jgi:amino acid transporter